MFPARHWSHKGGSTRKTDIPAKRMKAGSFIRRWLRMRSRGRAVTCKGIYNATEATFMRDTAWRLICVVEMYQQTVAVLRDMPRMVQASGFHCSRCKTRSLH